MKPLKEYVLDGLGSVILDKLTPEERETVADVTIAACRRWLELRWPYWEEDVRQLLNRSSDFQADLFGLMLGQLQDAREALDNLQIDKNTEEWIFRALLLLLYEEIGQGTE